MLLHKGDMFKILYWQDYQVMLVTTNATIRKDGSLVMGRGAALSAAKMWPRLPKDLGRIIKERPIYGVIVPIDIEGVMIGAFQVKHHWRDRAALDLIERSTAKLVMLANTFPCLTFALNFPGIGNGGLERERVLPIIEQLPDNVHVWEL